MQSAVEVLVSGRVQMVMFRDFTRHTARALGLVGEVQNLADGTVQITAEGARAALEQFVETLRRGSLFSRVDAVAAEWKEPSGRFTSFVIRYS